MSREFKLSKCLDRIILGQESNETLADIENECLRDSGFMETVKDLLFLERDLRNTRKDYRSWEGIKNNLYQYQRNDSSASKGQRESTSANHLKLIENCKKCGQCLKYDVGDKVAKTNIEKGLLCPRNDRIA
ncbi:MAG: hypothetical protein HQL32_03780 [Planctomycetes bacterium]|nr:hypothetical protein [Planctomycetota bacterium]